MLAEPIYDRSIPDSALETVSELEAARLLSIGVASLRKMRRLNQGPLVTKIGCRYRYQRRHLMAWLDDQTRAA